MDNKRPGLRGVDILLKAFVIGSEGHFVQQVAFMLLSLDCPDHLCRQDSGARGFIGAAGSHEDCAGISVVWVS